MLSETSTAQQSLSVCYDTRRCGSWLQPEKHIVQTPNNDAVKCILTLLGDNIVQAEVAIRYAKAPGHMFHSTAQPHVQWKIQQVQDVGNYILKALEGIKSASQMFLPKRSFPGSKDSVEITIQPRQLLQIISDIISDLQSARSCLMSPKKRSIQELQDYKPNKCFTPPLPNDMLLSFYIVSHKLMCAAYILQETPHHHHQHSQPINGKQTFQVMQGEVIVPWLTDILSLLYSALLLAQQFQDKLNLFYNMRDIREFINNQPEVTRENPEELDPAPLHL